MRVSEATGRARVRAVAQDLGVAAPIADGPALALGVSEATLLEMTGAYAGILNQRRARPALRHARAAAASPTARR